MIKSVKVATLVSAMLFSAGVMAQSNSEVVTKPAPSTESKPPVGASSKSRAEVKGEAKTKTGSTEVLKPGQNEESRAATTNSTSGKTRADVKHDSKMEHKKGTTADGMNEPDSAYQKNPAPKTAPAKN